MIFSIFIGFCNHHHSQVENISSPSKETLSPLVVTPHILQLTPPSTVYSLSLWICLFQTFGMYRIIHVVLGD